MMGRVPLLVDPALPAGSLRTIDQPCLAIAEQLALRPWREEDAATVRTAFACPDIQRWHVRRMDSDDEARGWIADWAKRWDDETDASWAIVRRRDDQAIGQVGLRTVILSPTAGTTCTSTLGYGPAPNPLRDLTRTNRRGRDRSGCRAKTSPCQEAEIPPRTLPRRRCSRLPCSGRSTEFRPSHLAG
jgi:hypothetical protein